jgi:hypothetical protein
MFNTRGWDVSLSWKCQFSLTHRISLAAERWYVEKGTWPANNLSDTGADANYFPDGVPVGSSAYTRDVTASPNG